jgi:hypothetical protein
VLRACPRRLPRGIPKSGAVNPPSGSSVDRTADGEVDISIPHRALFQEFVSLRVGNFFIGVSFFGDELEDGGSGRQFCRSPLVSSENSCVTRNGLQMYWSKPLTLHISSFSHYICCLLRELSSHPNVEVPLRRQKRNSSALKSRGNLPSGFRWNRLFDLFLPAYGCFYYLIYDSQSFNFSDFDAASKARQQDGLYWKRKDSDGLGRMELWSGSSKYFTSLRMQEMAHSSFY